MIVYAPSAWRTQPWKNGAGTTHEIVRWPDTDAYAIRISVADVTAPAPFSTFPGITRWLYLLAGGPVTLALPDHEHVLRAPGDGLEFDGEALVAATHVGRPSRDLNIMVRRPHDTRVRIVRGPGRIRLAGNPIAVFVIVGEVTVDETVLPPLSCAWHAGTCTVRLAADAIVATMF